MNRIAHKLIAAALVVSALVAVPVFAQEGEEQNDDTVTTNSTKVEDSGKKDDTASNRAAKQAELKQKREALRGKLSEVKKKVCENRKERITKLMTKAADAGQKGKEFFDSALERIDNFYTKKNLSVANYGALVATVKAKQEAVKAAVAAVRANVNFDCSAENPIGKVDAFNGQVVAMRAAMKEYRTALKALLEAVKTAAKAAEGSN